MIKLRTIPDIMLQLERSINIAEGQNDRELSKIILIACKLALQAHAIKLMEKRFKIKDYSHEIDPSLPSMWQPSQIEQT